MMPSVGNALGSFNTTLIVIEATTGIVDGEAVQTNIRETPFRGTLQPGKQVLEVTREGERRWRQWLLSTVRDFATDSTIRDPSGRTFKIVEKLPWLGSHREYVLKESTE